MKFPSYLFKIGFLISLLIFTICGRVYAAEPCYSKMNQVLGCFFSHDDGAYRYKFLEENRDNSNLIKRTYLLYSQKWPIGPKGQIDYYDDMPTTTWQHKLIFYIPKKISHEKALLYINGGLTRGEKGDKGRPPYGKEIDFVHIASNNEALVIELQMVPNQYLFFNSKPFKEDPFVCYTYERFIEDPFENAYLPGHLPMAKAILKAMDATQEIFKDIKGFVLSGASKRGWAVWLASLEDDRVEAIIPINIDILNTQKNISHICNSYGGVCPSALRKYYSSLVEILGTPVFFKLMDIEDPYSYLQDGYDLKYRARLSIPKYIINASGDDFFVPDSSRWYFKNLPGRSNYIRYLPNARHYFSGNFISDSTDSLKSIDYMLDSYFYFVLNNISLPKVSWILNQDGIEINSSIRPDLVKLWNANNENVRDFHFFDTESRWLTWRYFSKWVKSIFSSTLCDVCYSENDVDYSCSGKGSCKIDVSLPTFTKGWQASFVELHYKIDGHDFIITTEVNITPDVMPVRLPAQEL